MRNLKVFLVALLVALFVTLVASAPLPAARTPILKHPVHRGSSGKQVLAVKWILSGHDPSVYRKTIRTFHGPRSPECGKPCVRAILGARWLLGAPLKYDKRCHCRPAKRPAFGRDMYLMMTGKKAPPLKWIGIRAVRLAQIKAKHARVQRARQASSCAQTLIRNAGRELGNHEIPWGSNTGPRVRLYQAATTYPGTGWPWCMSFVQFIARETGVLPTGNLGSPFRLTLTNYRTPGPIANGTAGVYVAFHAAQSHGWLRARPVVGAIVLYMTNGGHTGYVTGVSRTGFSTIEGNSGDAVKAHSFPFGYRQPVFLVLPCVQAARGELANAA